MKRDRPSRQVARKIDYSSPSSFTSTGAVTKASTFARRRGGSDEEDSSGSESDSSSDDGDTSILSMERIDATDERFDDYQKKFVSGLEKIFDNMKVHVDYQEEILRS